MTRRNGLTTETGHSTAAPRGEGSFDGRRGGASLDHVQGKGDRTTTPDRIMKQKLDKEEQTKKKDKRIKGIAEEQMAAFGVK